MITAIIQARTSSSRLPKKVLMDLPFGSGISALAQGIRRTKRSKRIDQVIVATTQEEEDSAIVTIAEREGALSFRGSRENVLERYFMAAKQYVPEHVVRITSDCPCIDPDIVDLVIDRHLAQKADYTSNAVIRSYPDGLDVEVFTFEALKKAYHHATSAYEREHVTPYIHDSPDIFKILHVEAPKGLMAPEMRITLDTREDYIVLCFVFDCLFDKNPFFSAVDIMDLFKKRSWLHFINQNITPKKHCETLEDEIKELMDIAKFQNYQKGQKFLEEYLLGITDKSIRIAQ